MKMACSKFTAKRIQEEWTEKSAFYSPSSQHKTHVLSMPGDYGCDEDFQFETTS